MEKVIEWQPIETAPKGLILVYRPPYIKTNDDTGEAYNEPQHWAETYLVTNRWNRMKPLPTHWSPLLDPPK